MELTDTFHVPTGVDAAFATLRDLERVAPCLPGATLDEVDGGTYTGSMKVKVGPITVVYHGTARVVEEDADAGRVRIEASGTETRGSGTAEADVVATLAEVDGGTEVTVVTDLSVTGKAAQFGRAVMADVGSRIVAAFAERLSDLVTGEQQDVPSEPEPSEPEPSEPEPSEAEPSEAEPSEAEPSEAEPSEAEPSEPEPSEPEPSEPEPSESEPSEEAERSESEPSEPEPSEEAPAGDAPSGGEAVATGAAAVGAAVAERAAGRDGPTHVAQPDGDDVRDLADMSGTGAARPIAVLVAVLAVVAGVIWWLRRR